MGTTDKTWPYIKSDLDHDTLARFEKIKYRNGIVSGMGVLSDGTLQAGAFVVDGHHWVEDLDVSGAFNFSSLLNQGSQSTNVLYARYTYTATDPHANAVYGFAASLPSDAVKLGTIVVPASTSAITQGMINTTDSNRDLSNKYLAEAALPVSDPRVPTQDENDALEGMSAPSAANKFATAADLAAGGADNLGNHTAAQNINFNAFRGINCTDPVNDQDVATKKYVTDNIPTQNLALSISALRKHTLELELLIEGMTNSPYPDNFGQPFFRTEFDNIGSYVYANGKSMFQSDHDIKQLTAQIVSLKEAERGRIDTRLQLPKQLYFGEIERFVNIPDIADKLHGIVYAPDTQKLYMITYGSQADDTVLHCIDPFTLQIERSWFFDESSFTRWNGIASGIAFGAAQLYIIEHDAVNLGAVCIRFNISALPAAGIKITKANVSAIESANSVDSIVTEVFKDIAYDTQANYLWAIKKIAASNHKLTRLKSDFTENGTLAYGGIDVDTSGIDTSINGLDYDGDYLWFTGDTWTGRMDIAGNVNTKFKQYGKTGICRVIDENVTAAHGQLFNTDEINNTMRMIGVRNTFSLPATATYNPIHTVAVISAVNNTNKTVTVNDLDGTATTFGVNEYKGFYMRAGNAHYPVTSNTANVITLNTTADISGLTGVVEVGAIRRNMVMSVTVQGTKVLSYEGGVDNVVVTSAGFMFAKDTEVNAIGIELGTITTPADLTLRIETNLNGAPSGTLANANATTTIASASLVADSWNTAAFAVMFTLAADTIYHVVISTTAVADIKGHTSSNNKFNIQAGTLNYRLYNSARLSTNNVADVAKDNKKLYVGYTSSASSQIVQPGSAGMDTYITEDTPAINYGADNFIKLSTAAAGTADIWSGLDPANPLSARRSHSAEIDGSNMYVFGGRILNTTGILNDLWVYGIPGNAWSQLSPTGGPPPARIGHGSSILNGKIYVFGGHTSSYDETVLGAHTNSRDSGVLGDLWVYDIAANTWTELASGPPARGAAKLAGYNGKLYLFGGSSNSESGPFLNDIWEYNISGNVWQQLSPSGALPSPRDRFSMVLYAGKLYVYGGRGASTYNNELWEYNISANTWTQKASGATARMKHVGVIYGGKMYIYAGFVPITDEMGDTWEYNITSDAWTQRTLGLAGLRDHSAAVYDGAMYVFGGQPHPHDGPGNKILKYAITTGTFKARGLIKFDLTGLPSSVDSAKFGIHLSNADITSKTIDVHQITQDFIAGEAAWDMYQKAVVTGTQTENFTITSATNDKLLLTVDGGSQQTVTLTAGTRTAAQIATDINAVFTGLAADDGGKVKLTANKSIVISAITNDAYTVLGFTAGTTSTTWTAAGGDYNATPVASKAVTNIVGFIEYDITTLYNGWKAGTQNNYGLLLKITNETFPDIFIDFASSDNSQAIQRPRLILETSASGQQQGNVGVLIKDKSININYGTSMTQRIKIVDDFVFIALSDKIKIFNSADNTELQIIDNTTFPGITSTIINDMAAKKLVVDIFMPVVNRFLVVVNHNGVTVINLDVGSSYAVMNYELASNTAICKRAEITNDGYLIIATKVSDGIDQIDIFGNITRIFASYTKKSWDVQTGFRRTLKGPSGEGIAGALPEDTINALVSVTKVGTLSGYDTSLILIANGSSLVEYDLTQNTVVVVDNISTKICKDVAYWRQSMYAIFSGGDGNELRQYDTYLKRLISATGKAASFNSQLFLELAQDFERLLVEEDKIMATSSAGLEIIDEALKDTAVFEDALWASEKLYDVNGIARATVLLKNIVTPREMLFFSSVANKGAANIAVTFGRLGALVSKGDTLMLYSTSSTSEGSGETVLVSPAYDEASSTIPFAATILNENINTNSTTIKLADQSIVDDIPLRGTIKIDAEEIAYDGKSGASVMVASRGVNGTTAASHNTGATVQTVLRHDYAIGDIIVFFVARKQIDKLIDIRVAESSDGDVYTEGNQILIEDVNAGYYAEAVKSDLPYGQLKIGLKRTDYEEDSVKIDAAAMYWENY